MNPNEIIQNLPKYIQALYSDGTLYWSGDQNIATNERKNIVISDIKLIKANIESLEKALV
jgi:hypothetical protein